MAEYEGQPFKILGFGRQGGARIRLPNGKTCFVDGVPKGHNNRVSILIENYRERPESSADVARYAGTQDMSAPAGQVETIAMITTIAYTLELQKSATMVSTTTVMEIQT